MKNYSKYENKFRATGQKIIIAMRNEGSFRLYWRSLGYRPTYVWKMLHQRIR